LSVLVRGLLFSFGAGFGLSCVFWIGVRFLGSSGFFGSRSFFIVGSGEVRALRCRADLVLEVVMINFPVGCEWVLVEVHDALTLDFDSLEVLGFGGFDDLCLLAHAIVDERCSEYESSSYTFLDREGLSDRMGRLTRISEFFFVGGSEAECFGFEIS
jgi:hypothetical protein